jgi:hypothetical protein
VHLARLEVKVLDNLRASTVQAEDDLEGAIE